MSHLYNPIAGHIIKTFADLWLTNSGEFRFKVVTKWDELYPKDSQLYLYEECLDEEGKTKLYKYLVDVEMERLLV